MKKLLLKSASYFGIIVLLLEVYVRVFHLYSDMPNRTIDGFDVEKNLPNQAGLFVTGNRKQLAVNYKINASGFNSVYEKVSDSNDLKIALVGDSYIEGLHQDYTNSLGTMIERKLPKTEVYEYGCAAYDLANQLHFIRSNREVMDKMDLIILYVKYENDLKRSKYEPNYELINYLDSPIGKLRQNIKLLSYIERLGLINEFGRFVRGRPTRNKARQEIKNRLQDGSVDSLYISNFEKLLQNLPLDKSKTKLLLNGQKTSRRFIRFCAANSIEIIDFGPTFENSEKKTDYGYDKHWNSHGRELIAKSIAKDLKKSMNIGWIR